MKGSRVHGRIAFAIRYVNNHVNALYRFTEAGYNCTNLTGNAVGEQRWLVVSSKRYINLHDPLSFHSCEKQTVPYR